MKNNSLLLAFLGGIALGAVAALLFAPDSGENTRKKIKEALADYGADGQKIDIPTNENAQKE